MFRDYPHWQASNSKINCKNWFVSRRPTETSAPSKLTYTSLRLDSVLWNTPYSKDDLSCLNKFPVVIFHLRIPYTNHPLRIPWILNLFRYVNSGGIFELQICNQIFVPILGLEDLKNVASGVLFPTAVWILKGCLGGEDRKPLGWYSGKQFAPAS